MKFTFKERSLSTNNALTLSKILSEIYRQTPKNKSTDLKYVCKMQRLNLAPIEKKHQENINELILDLVTKEEFDKAVEEKTSIEKLLGDNFKTFSEREEGLLESETNVKVVQETFYEAITDKVSDDLISLVADVDHLLEKSKP